MPPEPKLSPPVVSREVSPTGAPLLPPKVVPYVVGACAIAWGVAQILPDHTLGDRFAQGVVALCAVFGVMSPGFRR